MLEYTDVDLSNSGSDDLKETVPSPDVTILETDSPEHGRFILSPVPRGYGVTIGNSMRRILFSSLPGTAIISVKINGALHEYTTIPHVKEEVSEILLNLKLVRIKSSVERPGKLRLECQGRRTVTAADIMPNPDFEIMNPDLYIATLDSDDADLSLELNVGHGVGYQKDNQIDGASLGVLPVDSVFSPVLKTNYNVETVRIGDQTDLESVTIDLWTNLTMEPLEAVRQAGDILVQHFFLFANANKLTGHEQEGLITSTDSVSAEHYNMTVEELNLSARTLNCLKRTGLDKVGDVLQYPEDELLKIRNFGKKSLDELHAKFDSLGITKNEDVDDDENAIVEDKEDISEA
ncbi:MAG: DNA-directed RNA polymerase subunit alpha [Chloroflexota bacterium]|nr:MAG: DNA-directed RNA polymerase subunit alpha [Chloroflexota bacterium]